MCISFILATMFACIYAKSQEKSRGLVILDSITFPKIVPNPHLAVVVLIYHKKQIGDYSTDSILADYLQFAELAQFKGEAENILFSQVIVNGAENGELARRIVNSEFTHPKLFIFPKDSSIGVPYPNFAPFTMNSMARFVAKYSDFYIYIPGTIREFDEFTSAFVESPDIESLNLVMDQAKNALNKISDPLSKKNGQYYIDLMNVARKNGMDGLKKELKQLLQTLETEKASNAIRQEITDKVNICSLFISLHHDVDEPPSSLTDEM